MGMKTMSNSKLITYTNITNDRNSPRNHKIDTITIHCYVGQVTAKQGCDYFASTSRQVSSNYVVGKDGSIGLSVPESDRAWTSSSPSNDHRAITIETACNQSFPYAVTDSAYNALINLVADICQRNGINKLVWSNNRDDRINHRNGCNMTVHRDFASTDCPGKYLYDRMGDIAAAVNAKIGTVSTAETANVQKKSFLPTRGYFKKGDISANVAKIAKFMRKTFPLYTSVAALGYYYGNNIIKSITEFQRRTGLEPDGCIGPKTLAMLEKYGFTE
jgi:hypothetical protein